MRRALVRIGAAATLCAALALVLVQFGRMVRENVLLSAELARTRADVTALKMKRDREERDVGRLRDASGSVPAIHERLGEVGPHEAIIYLKEAPSPKAASEP